MSRKRAKLSPFTVIGELLLLAGLGVFGFLLWQPWYTETVIAKAQSELSTEVTDLWKDAAATAEYDGEVPVPQADPDTGVFGVMYVPAFGDNWANQLVTGKPMNPVMASWDYGVAHYDGTALPGESGNIALAAHRSGSSATPFRNTDFLRVGDPVFIETADGWYTYRFRDFEYVWPTAVEVLNPMPHVEGTFASHELLTFTTCNPKYLGVSERMIAYSVFESFTPRAEGAPEELRTLNSDVAAAYTASGSSADTATVTQSADGDSATTVIGDSQSASQTAQNLSYAGLAGHDTGVVEMFAAIISLTTAGVGATSLVLARRRAWRLRPIAAEDR